MRSIIVYCLLPKFHFLCVIRFFPTEIYGFNIFETALGRKLKFCIHIGPHLKLCTFYFLNLKSNMAVRRHFEHFIKVFLEFGSFPPMVGSWNLHNFSALFIAVHITFIFWNKIFNMAAKRHFLHFCHVFLLFGAFKGFLSKCLSWFYVYWFLKLLIQQKC